jgi:hypothetical protein
LQTARPISAPLSAAARLPPVRYFLLFARDDPRICHATSCQSSPTPANLEVVIHYTASVNK